MIFFFFRKKMLRKEIILLFKKTVFWISFFFLTKKMEKKLRHLKIQWILSRQRNIVNKYLQNKRKKTRTRFHKKNQAETWRTCCEGRLGRKEWGNKIQENLWMVMRWANNITPHKILIIGFRNSCYPARGTAASSAMWDTHTQQGNQKKNPTSWETSAHK